MATTTNYGWTTPDDTALVKDGAAAIRSLGSSIDTSLNTALGTKKAGLVLLNTTSFSAVASQAIPLSTFSANYQNYRIILYLDSVSADASLYVKMRASGTDNSDAQYSLAFGTVTRTGTSGNSAQNASNLGWLIGQLDSGVSGRFYAWTLDLYNPFLAQNTLMTAIGNAVTTASIPYSVSGGGFHEVATSYDQINIIASAGNITGKVSVYGYNF